MERTRPASVYNLEPGVVYIVTKSVIDYHGGRFEPGELLTFESRAFLPYHGGHTIAFREKALYLQEEEHAEILQRFGDYFAVHDASRRTEQSKPNPAPKPRSSSILTFLGSFGLFLLFVAIGIRGGESRLMVAAGLTFFGAVTAVNAWDWWTSRKQR